MAQQLDVRPQIVDVLAYAGDTLTIRVIASRELTTGKQWDAQVRLDPSSPVISATFTITPPTETDDSAYLVLPASVTRALAGNGVLVNIRKGKATYSVQRFSGVWDCQISIAGSDPVRTLGMGQLTIDQDITRITP